MKRPKINEKEAEVGPFYKKNNFNFFASFHFADLTITITKREEKLRKKERQLEEEMTEREKLEKEVDRLTKEVASLQSLTKRQEQALAKKDKMLQENGEELNEMRRIHEQIFNLSKKTAAK